MCSVFLNLFYNTLKLLDDVTGFLGVFLNELNIAIHCYDAYELFPSFYINYGCVYIHHLTICIIAISLCLWISCSGFLLPWLVTKLREQRFYERVWLEAKDKPNPLKYISKVVKKKKIKNRFLYSILKTKNINFYNTYYWWFRMGIIKFLSYFCYLLFFILASLQLFLFFIANYTSSLNFFVYLNLLNKSELSNIYLWNCGFYFYIIFGLAISYIFYKPWDIFLNKYFTRNRVLYCKIFTLKTIVFLLLVVVFQISFLQYFGNSVVDVDVFIYWDILLFLSSIIVNGKTYWLFKDHKAHNNELDLLFGIIDTFKLRPSTDCYREPHPDFYSLLRDYSYCKRNYKHDVYIKKYSGTHYKEMSHICNFYKKKNKSWPYDPKTIWPFTEDNHPHKAVSEILKRYLTGQWEFDRIKTISPWFPYIKSWSPVTTPFTSDSKKTFFLNYGDKLTGLVNACYFHSFLCNLLTITTALTYVFIFLFSKTQLINDKAFYRFSMLYIFVIVIIALFKLSVFFFGFVY